VCVALLGAACSGGGGGAASGPTSTRPADPLLVPTDLGPVRGRPAGGAAGDVRAFLALPYAAPPTGANRWRPPQARAPYGTEFDATKTGASCPQNVGGSTARFIETPPPDEDCLTLSVWAPAAAEKLPVMFWIHGGGLRAGSAHQPYYGGDVLASKGVVVVGVNYRLGPFGFLATDGLARESADGSVGDYGLADQTAGLEWVKRNVAAFGGDPTNVTIFGESAGGGSVCAHLASRPSKGLFHRAIIQSGGGCDRVAAKPEALAAGAELSARLGCGDAACLRAKPTDEIVAAGSGGAFVADGVRLSGTGREAAERGGLDGIPVLIGSNAEEALLLTITQEEPGPERLDELFKQMAPDDPAALLALYPAERYDSRLSRYRAMFTEANFTCPAFAFAQAAKNDVFVYHYTYRSADSRFGIGPTHGAELAFLFAHPEGILDTAPGLSGRDAAVSTAMQTAWTAFARTGVPDDGSAWRRYGDGRKVTIIDEQVKLVDGAQVKEGRCDAVTALTARRRSGP
jgi:para-nitrobenzyl esterase